MKQQQSITSLPASPEEERRSRMNKYMIAMGIRMVCIILMLFVSGWWLLVCAIGAIALPYFAVVAANVQSRPRAVPVLRPGGLEIYRGDGNPADSSAPHTTNRPDQ
ncbi:DUF3099 domain-containing protein [Cryobacterium sp. CG_9.6]|uniref:DUF3099 domain-containing protein n=1 Tax=Cryobacterium sp. CG_9.6 TaxID=2760710 RepID=UPI002473B0F9|nr:DUF3099 domain-containing protein [Cryobacterium sp. CG_9.6]MDH6236944.1 hypothetical protein [Cryobacterium sp. CG_9.6]